jgi:hypothetical protein
LQYLFCSNETKQKTISIEKPEKEPEDREVYYTRSRINSLVLCIITTMILILLIVPVYILWNLVNKTADNHTDAVCIGVLLVFTLAFSAILSLFTRARRHEIFGAAAAYCAVLVVFFGNLRYH